MTICRPSVVHTSTQHIQITIIIIIITMCTNGLLVKDIHAAFSPVTMYPLVCLPNSVLSMGRYGMGWEFVTQG